MKTEDTEVLGRGQIFHSLHGGYANGQFCFTHFKLR